MATSAFVGTNPENAANFCIARRSGGNSACQRRNSQMLTSRQLSIWYVALTATAWVLWQLREVVRTGGFDNDSGAEFGASAVS